MISYKITFSVDIWENSKGELGKWDNAFHRRCPMHMHVNLKKNRFCHYLELPSFAACLFLLCYCTSIKRIVMSIQNKNCTFAAPPTCGFKSAPCLCSTACTSLMAGNTVIRGSRNDE